MKVLPVTYTFMTSFPPQYTPSHEMLHKAAFTVSPTSDMSSMQEHLLFCNKIFALKYCRYHPQDIFFFNFEMQWHYDRLNGNTVERTLWTFASKRLLKRDAGIKELFKFSYFLFIKIHTYQHIDTETAKAVAL